MMSTEWTTVGYVETSESGDVTHGAVSSALLPHNPRRNLVQAILLSSNNTKATGFITDGGLSSVGARRKAVAPPPATKPLPPTCTDFVLVGLAENSINGVPLQEAQKALLDREGTHSAIQLTSDNKRCTHFVTNGECSTTLTNHDVLWMESVAGCRPGT